MVSLPQAEGHLWRPGGQLKKYVKREDLMGGIQFILKYCMVVDLSPNLTLLNHHLVQVHQGEGQIN